MRFVDECPFCVPSKPVYLRGDNWRVICTDEPNHYVLAPKEHLTCTAKNLARCSDMFEAIEGMGWPMEIVVHLNSWHTSVNHLHAHLYRKG